MKRLVSIVLVLSFMLSFCTYASASVVREDSRQCDYGKMSEEVIAFFEAAEDEDVIDVYVIIEDVDEDEVMATFAERYPDEYAEYMKAYEADVPPEIIAGDKAKMEEEILRDDLNNNIDGDLLQAGIEKKREVFRGFYNEKNNEVLKEYFDDDQVAFCSEYAPMAIVHATKLQLLSLVDEKLVIGVDKYEDLKGESFLSTAYQTTNVNYLRDTCGNKGANVKIGQLEMFNYIPDVTNTYLSSATISCYPTGAVVNTHATQVAKILVGNSSVGVAPLASLYCRGISDNALSYYIGVEYLISQGVNVINFSGGFGCCGTYDGIARWTDHIARQHDVHFVASAGQVPNLDDYTPLVATPAIAYNVITVGAYNTHNTVSDSDDTLWALSNYIEDNTISLVHAEKPNLVAPGEAVFIPGYGTDNGTSISAPIVAGVIADLCSYNYALKVKQTAIGAIMAASCTYKIDGSQPGVVVYGDSFHTSVRLDDNPQISMKEGAGKLNAKAARYIVTTAQWWGTSINASAIPYTQTVYINSASNSLTRIALFWLKRNSLTGSHQNNVFNEEVGFSNLNLQVIAPNGTVVASSTAVFSNFEIAQFSPTITGNYTIKVTRPVGDSSIENIGIAVY